MRSIRVGSIIRQCPVLSHAACAPGKKAETSKIARTREEQEEGRDGRG